MIHRTGPAARDSTPGGPGRPMQAPGQAARANVVYNASQVPMTRAKALALETVLAGSVPSETLLRLKEGTPRLNLGLQVPIRVVWR